MKAFFATTPDYTTLFLRVASGAAMLPFGLMKVGLIQLPNMSGGIDQTIAMMGQMGVPTVITILVIIAETLGALALILGFCTRFCAASLAVIMLAAIWFTFGMGYFSGYVIPLLFLFIFVALTINGGGKWSVDDCITKRLG